MIDLTLSSLRRRLAGSGQGRSRPDALNVSYSRLALRLERDLRLAGRGRSVLVTAADDDRIGVDAVTELAWYLAEELGHTVLLIDGTFSLARLSHAFGIGDTRGLMELLSLPHIDSAELRGARQPTRHENIFLVTRGHGDNGRMVAARSEAVRALLDIACNDYDFVLVQGSVLDESSRSMAFGGFVDAALLVAVEGKTLIHAIQHGQRILNESGAERVGLVLASAAGGRNPASS